MSHLKKKVASLASVCVATPLLMLGAATAAHADGTVTWQTSTAMSGCLQYGLTLIGNTQGTDPFVGGCNPSGWRSDQFYDVDEGSGQWLERAANSPHLCMTAYWDHSVYFESCANGGSGNSYERWREINTGGGWHLQNVATGEYLNSNSNGTVYTDAFQQYWH